MFGKLESAQMQIDLVDWFPGPLPNRESLKVSEANCTFLPPRNAWHSGVFGMEFYGDGRTRMRMLVV
jgi:hypothetical protein